MSLLLSADRTKNYYKQVKASFIFKLLAVVCSFLVIPLMIKYLGDEQYGIWSTLLSIISWIVLFDIGIGNGLRNKVAESLAKDDIESAQSYISTAYVIIGFVAFFLMLIFLVANNYIPWQQIFNTKILSSSELKNVVVVSFFFVLLKFWLSLIDQISNGLQKTSLVVLNQFIVNFFALILVFFLYRFTTRSLFNLAFVYGFSLVFSNIVISGWIYSKNRYLLPRLRFFRLSKAKGILNLGFQFFIIQVAVIVIFTTDKILITQLFGPEYVTSYDVVFKLFSVVSILYTLMVGPLWSAYSDAYHRKDIKWIKNALKNQLKTYSIIFFVIVVMIFLARPIILLWTGHDYGSNIKLIICIAIFILVSTWNNIFAYFVNATNHLKVQLITAIIAIFANIPLSILLVKFFKFNVHGIVIATSVSLSLFSFCGPIQVYLILRDSK